MLPYKIVEFEPGKFHVLTKYWIFWWTLQESSYAGDYDRVFESLEDAELTLRELARQRAEAKAEKARKAKFKKVVYHYREDGYPPDNWLPKLPPL